MPFVGHRQAHLYSNEDAWERAPITWWTGPREAVVETMSALPSRPTDSAIHGAC